MLLVTHDNSIVYWSTDFWGTINAFSSFTTLFWCQPFICEIARYTKQTKQRYIIRIIYISTALVAIFNFCIALFGHFYIWGKAEDNYMLDYYPQKNILTILGTIGSLINCITTNCGYVLIVSQLMFKLFTDKLNTIGMFFGSIVFMSLAASLSFHYAGKFEFVYELIGSIVYSIMGLIVPSLLYLFTYGVCSATGISSLSFLLFCIAISILVIICYFK